MEEAANGGALVHNQSGSSRGQSRSRIQNAPIADGGTGIGGEGGGGGGEDQGREVDTPSKAFEKDSPFFNLKLADFHFHVNSSQISLRGLLQATPLFICMVIFILSMVTLHQSVLPDPTICLTLNSNHVHIQRSALETSVGTALSLNPGGSNARKSKYTPSVTIFSAPLPFTSDPEDPQLQALLSWVKLAPFVKIVLFGKHKSITGLAARFPKIISADENVDYNHFGLPLFHSILARAQVYHTDLSVVIRPDVILLVDILPTLFKLKREFHRDWFLVANTWDIQEGKFPFRLDKPEPDNFQEKVRSFVRKEGVLRSDNGVEFWAWNNSPAPLCNISVPPFAMVAGELSRWLLNEAVRSGMRDVIDGTEVVTTVHVAHSGWNKRFQRPSPIAGRKKRSLKSSKWEKYGNKYLAYQYGSFDRSMGIPRQAPWKLLACSEPSAGYICVTKRSRPMACSCEFVTTTAQTRNEPMHLAGGRRWLCGVATHKSPVSLARIVNPGDNSARSPIVPLHEILSQVALHVDNHLHIVTLVAVFSDELDLLMNFVCTLRRLKLSDHLLVAALDEKAYIFAFTQGLAVYYAAPSVNRAVWTPCDSRKNCSQLKSEIVLPILKLGYSVLWSDVDVVWFGNPLPELVRFGRGSFLVQSNEWRRGLPGNGDRHLSSGFFFARSEQKVMKALASVIDDAQRTKKSEDESLYDVLCGVKGSRRDPNGDECLWEDELRVIFLEREVYPSGAIFDIWASGSVQKTCEKLGCKVLQNDAIPGQASKEIRLKEHGLWVYDSGKRMCIHDWHPLQS